MKKFLALLLALVMVFALVACGNEPAPTPSQDPQPEQSQEPAGPDPIKIVFATPNADANIESEYAQKWIAAVEEASEGKITFDYTNSGALGTYDELLEGTINGTYDMTITEPSYIAPYVPESALLSLPMLYSSYDEADWILDGEVGQWYNDLCREQGMEILNYFYCGFRYIISQDKITSLADCDGVIIRSPSIQTYLDTLQMLGFKCETMAFSEAYTAMETGVISAVECPLQNLYSSGYQNMCDYLLGSRHLLSANCIVANEDFWAGLPEEYKEILTTAIADITAEERVECAAREQQFLDDFAAAGTEFNDFDADSMAKIVEMFTEYWNTALEETAPEALPMLEKIVAHKG